MHDKVGHSSPIKIGVVTVARSDFGIYESLLMQLKKDPAFELHIFATGAHFSPQFGTTVSEITNKGFEYIPGLEMLLDANSPQSIGKSVGLGIISLSQAFAINRPDLLLVLGDRIEMVCGPVVALSFNIPVAHIGGGAVTEGAIDEFVRHAITKMSHIHFVICELYAKRIRQMGEEPWRVCNVGSPALDRIVNFKTMPIGELSEKVGLDLTCDTLLVTFHPVTLELEDLKWQVDNLMESLSQGSWQVVVTYPNADVGNEYIIQSINQFANKNKDRVRILQHAGTEIYLSLMASVKAMVGNTSSGVAEAPSFKLPVVNIGTRQDGKVHAENVIDVGYSETEITEGINKALSAEFRESLQDMKSPYGDGHASEKIIDILKGLTLGPELLKKKFILMDE